MKIIYKRKSTNAQQFVNVMRANVQVKRVENFKSHYAYTNVMQNPPSEKSR